MRQWPKGGMIGKTVQMIREIQALQIPLHAANACYFTVLAVFPALLLFLEVLQYTPLEAGGMAQLLTGLLPEALADWARELILTACDKASGALVGVSAVTVLWSASRGIWGIRRGLNAIYAVTEHRGYLYARLISVVYLFVFLLILMLMLALHVFGSAAASALEAAVSPVPVFAAELLNLRRFLLPGLLTVFFAAVFMVLPNRRNGFRESLPGALLASAGWLAFSGLYSLYVERFAHLSNVYGSVYAVALSMLWLYCCMSIVFYGGALNAVLARKKKKTVSKP